MTNTYTAKQLVEKLHELKNTKERIRRLQTSLRDSAGSNNPKDIEFESQLTARMGLKNQTELHGVFNQAAFAIMEQEAMINNILDNMKTSWPPVMQTKSE